jgi:hypothetical protein
VTAFLMTWKETNWPHENIVRMVRTFERQNYVVESWRIKAHTKSTKGDRVWVLKQGRGPKVIFGVGEIISTPEAKIYEDGKRHWAVNVRFDAFVDPRDQFLIGEKSVAELLTPQQIRTRASGIRIDDKQSDALQTRFDDRRRSKDENEFQGSEGAQTERLIRHRQRESKFRDAKIADALKNNGGRLVCEVPRCGFDFADRYGEIGAGYAHVHHNKPLSDAPLEGRRITSADLQELSVVCANCHAMIHRGGECRPIDTLIAVETVS